MRSAWEHEGAHGPLRASRRAISEHGKRPAAARVESSCEDRDEKISGARASRRCRASSVISRSSARHRQRAYCESPWPSAIEARIARMHLRGRRSNSHALYIISHTSCCSRPRLRFCELFSYMDALHHRQQ
ncbi:unnamed protein product [Trichogramma brassicae]|uniref:Uncharacterized protein n=1 Tax=Trichogramma brassicae TaxID=86971 RepID=A0A6H5HZB1_9HYME|nr:unnamed protein product [Trichogramma brassicae]